MAISPFHGTSTGAIFMYFVSASCAIALCAVPSTTNSATTLNAYVAPFAFFAGCRPPANHSPGGDHLSVERADVAHPENFRYMLLVHHDEVTFAQRPEHERHSMFKSQFARIGTVEVRPSRVEDLP